MSVPAVAGLRLNPGHFCKSWTIIPILRDYKVAPLVFQFHSEKKNMWNKIRQCKLLMLMKSHLESCMHLTRKVFKILVGASWVPVSNNSLQCSKYHCVIRPVPNGNGLLSLYEFVCSFFLFFISSVLQHLQYSNRFMIHGDLSMDN